ncbi:hypothetical protein [Eubacterium maltosivorans]|uniref:hypothetical protein n=1 Tax=Eubacterium maltosivorans TaxID=2041044 RepID=UPI001A9A9924|nr:hypothetical protein [Eubacterium maltosivorans]
MTDESTARYKADQKKEQKEAAGGSAGGADGSVHRGGLCGCAPCDKCFGRGAQR